MTNKTLLKQAMRFENENPISSKVENLYKEALVYQTNNDTLFIDAKYRGRAEILNKKIFFEFITEDILDNGIVESFEDIQKILNAQTRQENIEATGDSKNSITRIFEDVVVFQLSDSNPTLYKNVSEIKVTEKILAVENGETFLNVHSIMSKFGFNNYVYLGGFSNRLTREFLKDKDVVFFLDYDIEAIRIYDSFECKTKSFFRHLDIENYFHNKKLRNEKLYRKQLSKLPEHHNELQWLIELIKENSAVIEQEVVI